MLAIMLGMADCLPPDPRPLYNELWATYGPNPDCLNRDRHIRYLTDLKSLPLRSTEIVTEAEYDQSLDIYIERLQWYCKTR
jgi:hypothetical protein